MSNQKLINMNTNEISAVDFKSNLSDFTGTFQYHQHRLANLSLNLTDGCNYVRNEAQAFWLFDAILSHQISSIVSKHPFQVWRLKLQEDESWKLSCEDGDRNILVVQNIEYSDFPIHEITIWLIDGVALLPTEY